MFKTTTALAALLFTSCASAVAADDVIITGIDAQRVAQIVAQEGFAVVATHDVDEMTLIHVKVNGTNVVLFVGEMGRNLQAYAAFGGTAADLRKINQWNKSKRFSRAYLDDDGDPVLESDLDLDGGITEQTITRFMKTYAVSLAAFEQEVCVGRPAQRQAVEPAAKVAQGGKAPQ